MQTFSSHKSARKLDINSTGYNLERNVIASDDKMSNLEFIWLLHRYKEGRIILERALIVESDGFDETPRPSALSLRKRAAAAQANNAVPPGSDNAMAVEWSWSVYNRAGLLVTIHEHGPAISYVRGEAILHFELLWTFFLMLMPTSVCACKCVLLFRLLCE